MSKQARLLIVLALGCGLISAGIKVSAETYPARIWQPKGPDIEASFVSKAATTVTVKLVNGETAKLKTSELSDEDLRYIKTITQVKNAFRTWTTKTESFKGSLLKTEGFDSPLTKIRAVIIRFDNGKAKGYAISDLNAEDQDYIKTIESKQPSKPAIKDSTKYLVKWDEYSPSKSPEKFNYHESEHFVFFWGNDIKPEAKNWSDPAFRQMNFEYIEKVWQHFKSINATLPSYNTAPKYKTNVYISLTGLSVYPDGFAWGADRILMCPGAMLAGSMVVPHEFGHTMQLASGAYRDSDYVGWFWECHANWAAGSFIPGLSSALGVYAERCHYELDSTRMNYGSWPFLKYIEEHPRYHPDFLFDIWKQAKRNAKGVATETPLETIIRLSLERKIFKGDGVQDFGDLIGQVAAHNVTWDYVYQDAYNLDLKYSLTNGAPYRGRTMVHPVADRPGWFAPLYSQTPRQLGYNIIDLKPQAGATKIEVDLQGIKDETLKSNWRCVLVAIDKNGQARYGRMWRQGAGSIALKPGETSAALVVTAAPDALVHTQFRPGYNKQKRHFPYEFKVAGATPATVPIGIKNHNGIEGAPHANGGGFVAATAHVDLTAYVGSDAQVLGRAQVLGNAQINDHAVVTDNAVISENARVGGYALVRRDGRVKGNARIRDYAVVQDRVTIQDDARVREFMNINGTGTIGGDALAKGFADVTTGSKAPIGGGTIMGQDSELNLGDCKTPIEYGTLYGFMTEEEVKKDVQDNRYLAAHWDMAHPRKHILIDSLTDNDGVLRGTAAFTKAGLNLDGGGYALFEGSVFDAAGFTIDMQVKWVGGKDNQRLISFGGPGGAFSFTPSNAHQKAEIIITKGRFAQYVEADSALPINQSVRVTLTYNGSIAKIYMNGKLIGSKTDVNISTDQMVPSAGYLGRAYEGGMFFKGMLSDVAIYRKAFPDFESIKPPYNRK
jgi:hypothetical protein